MKGMIRFPAMDKKTNDVLKGNSEMVKAAPKGRLGRAIMLESVTGTHE